MPGGTAAVFAYEVKRQTQRTTGQEARKSQDLWKLDQLHPSQPTLPQAAVPTFPIRLSLLNLYFIQLL